MERWHTNFRLINEKDMFKTNDLNIINGIFQRDSLSLRFYKATITIVIDECTDFTSAMSVTVI